MTACAPWHSSTRSSTRPASERGLSFASYVRDLAAHLRHSYAGNSESVQVRIDVEDIALDLDSSVPCGLIITELLSNALKHAFPGGRRGTVTVGLHRDAAGHARPVGER